MSYQELRCGWCSRLLYVAEVTSRGRVTRFEVHHVEPKLSQAGHLEARRVRRSLAAEESQNGVASRILLAIPSGPDVLGISKLAKKLSLPNAMVRDAVESLEAEGYIEAVPYGKAGYRWTGYRQVPRH